MKGFGSRLVRACASVLLTVALVAPQAGAQPASAPFADAPPADCSRMTRLLNSTLLMQTVDLITVRRFYAQHGATCAWPAAKADELVAALTAAAAHGLSPGLFHVDRLGPVAPGSAPEAAMIRDVLLTDAALKFARYVSAGIGARGERTADDPADRPDLQDMIARLGTALDGGSVRAWLAGLAPQYSAYVELQGALARYRQIAADGGWPQLPASLVRQRGRAQALATLQRRLEIEGDLAPAPPAVPGLPAPPVSAATVKAGLARFQWRNGLKADGELNARTLARLNISVGERIASLSLNLERLRTSLRDVPMTRVEVNLPAATTVFIRDGVPVLTMNAVIGAPQHETPELESAIDAIVVNPNWTIPRSIIENEIEPHIKRDRNYLRKNRMSWLRDQLIQEPGPWNALGRFKFDFPNPYAVYLHDTPARELFTDPERAASHGCVRLQRPLELALALLADDPRWDRAALEAVVAAGRTERIRLPAPVPVLLVYRTAFIESDGSVHFRPDVYGRDTQLTLDLAQRLETAGDPDATPAPEDGADAAEPAP